jgi:hypothetical protein
MPTRHTATRKGGQRNASGSIIAAAADVSAATLASNSEM